jgi:hypothetical protein
MGNESRHDLRRGVAISLLGWILLSRGSRKPFPPDLLYPIHHVESGQYGSYGMVGKPIDECQHADHGALETLGVNVDESIDPHVISESFLVFAFSKTKIDFAHPACAQVLQDLQK